MAATTVGTVTFGDLAALSEELYVRDRTFFVYDLDDTLFSARSNDVDVEPDAYAGLDGHGAPEVTYFADTVDDMPGFYVKAMGLFLRSMGAHEWTTLSAGTATSKDLDGNRVALMLGTSAWTPRSIRGVKTVRVRTERKLAEVEKLARLYPRRDVVFFDDRRTAFAGALDMPENVTLFHVVGLEDE